MFFCCKIEVNCSLLHVPSIINIPSVKMHTVLVFWCGGFFFFCFSLCMCVCICLAGQLVCVGFFFTFVFA